MGEEPGFYLGNLTYKYVPKLNDCATEVVLLNAGFLYVIN
jgi:hypothetical protein